jgi:uncharacterized protein (UPF0548 family)
VWLLRRPSRDFIDHFLRRQAGAPLSYAAVGATDGEPPAGYVLDHNRTRLGHGPAAFEAACAALRAWRQFPAPLAEVVPADAPLAPGQTVAVLARAYGSWWLNACRVVYVIHEDGPPRRFGFAYGTLAEHVESGEERFLVEQRADGSVWYDLRAFSRTNHWMVRVAYPLARRLQRRFARESLASMRQAVVSAGAGG